MIRQLFKFNGGVHPPQHKNESTRQPIGKGVIPKRLILPLHQHIGESAEPVVNVGDHVLKGQRIARAKGYISAPVHASSSGKVIAIDNFPIPHPSGLSAPCIVIETDGEDRWVEHPPEPGYAETNASHLRNMIRNAGIVGLGGAGFPSYIKLNPTAGKTIDTLILNGVECEPYITCDDMLMRERANEIVDGAKIMRYALQAKECVIAVEDNKPEAYQALKEATKNENIEVVQVPTLYPQGSEKQLIKVITNKECPSDGLPLHIGVVVHNVGTAAAVYRAISLGEPLISRIVTVAGDGVREAKNLEVLLGTPMQDILNQCGGLANDVDRVIMGGPMMGFAMHNSQIPVIKTTNCILAATHANVAAPSHVMPCIRCGACADACPVNLLPQQLYWYASAKEFDKTQDYSLFDCIECGCCAYVCPSNIPLVHYYRYAKTEIWSLEREKEKANLARSRHEFRLERIDREKAEKEARLAAKRAALRNKGPAKEAAAAQQAAIQTAMGRAKAGREKAAQMAKQREASHGKEYDANKQDLIKAALERAKAKKEATNIAPKNTDNLTEAQQQQINETDARRNKLDQTDD